MTQHIEEVSTLKKRGPVPVPVVSLLIAFLSLPFTVSGTYEAASYTSDRATTQPRKASLTPTLEANVIPSKQCIVLFLYTSPITVGHTVHYILTFAISNTCSHNFAGSGG